MEKRFLTYDEFLAHLERAPWPVIDLIIIEKDGIRLTFRRATSGDTSYEDMWQLPGGFLLKGESFEDCAQRIALKELGTNITGIPIKYSRPFNNVNEARGHLVHIPIVIDLRNKTVELPKTNESCPFRISTIYDLPALTILHHVTIIGQYLSSNVLL